MDSAILTQEVVEYKPFRIWKEQNLMPHLYDGEGNCNIITWIDDQFRPGIVVTVGQN